MTEVEVSSPISREDLANEYKIGVELIRHFSTMRRQDAVFVTTVQGAVLTIVGKNYPHLTVADYALTIVAAFVVVLGINTERRLAGYSNGYIRRISALEKGVGMALMAEGLTEVRGMKAVVSNYAMFLTYYTVLIVGWISLWFLKPLL